MKKYTYNAEQLEIVHAEEVIETGEPPVMAIRKKKDSSIVRYLKIKAFLTGISSAGIHKKGIPQNTLTCRAKYRKDFSVHIDDLLLVIRTASLANPVGHHKRAASAALYQSRSFHFPVCSSLIPSALGRFILRTNRHRYTSLFLKISNEEEHSLKKSIH